MPMGLVSNGVILANDETRAKNKFRVHLKQPLIVGYIISGIIAGHYFLNIITDGSGIELFSKLGIIILLFTIGLNLDPNTMQEVGRRSTTKCSCRPQVT